jgi:hypothetical protein
VEGAQEAGRVPLAVQEELFQIRGSQHLKHARALHVRVTSSSGHWNLPPSVRRWCKIRPCKFGKKRPGPAGDEGARARSARTCRSRASRGRERVSE